MPRTFGYLRVSTTGQTTDNQLQELAAAGFKVEPRRVVSETVSGTSLLRSAAALRVFSTASAAMSWTWAAPWQSALGGDDLTSSTGKLTMNVLNAVAEFERDLLVERTQAGLSRAKSEGKTLGRPLVIPR